MRKTRKPKKTPKKTPSEALQHLGDYLSAVRISCGLTQQELASQISRGLRHIQNIESGIANPSYEVLLDIVRRLGASGDIMFYPDIEKQEQEVRHLLNKFAACTEDERQILLKTLDCMAEQFIRRRYERSVEKKSE